MYPNMCPMNMYQMPMCCYMMPYNPMMAGQMMQPMMPYYDEVEKDKDKDKEHKHHRDENIKDTEQSEFRGYRCMRNELEPTEEVNRNVNQGIQMPQTDQTGLGHFGQMQPGTTGQIPGAAGTPGIPMQQMMTDLRIPLSTARQIILCILQAAQMHMQMHNR